nr:MAG TPA: hypothetical protein [Caudoviricetes sp.]
MPGPRPTSTALERIGPRGASRSIPLLWATST